MVGVMVGTLMCRKPEKRGVGHHLNRLPEAASRDLVQRECEHDRHRKAHAQRVDADSERVADEGPERRRGEKALEVPQPDPRTTPDSEQPVEVLERDLQPVHGLVREHEKVEQRRQDEQVELVVPGNTGDLLHPGDRGERSRSVRRGRQDAQGHRWSSRITSTGPGVVGPGTGRREQTSAAQDDLDFRFDLEYNHAEPAQGGLGVSVHTVFTLSVERHV